MFQHCPPVCNNIMASRLCDSHLIQQVTVHHYAVMITFIQVTLSHYWLRQKRVGRISPFQRLAPVYTRLLRRYPFAASARVNALIPNTEPVPIQFTQSAQLPPMSNQTPADFFHLNFTNEVLDKKSNRIRYTKYKNASAQLHRVADSNIPERRRSSVAKPIPQMESCYTDRDKGFPGNYSENGFA